MLIDDFLDTEFAHEVLRSWPSYEDAAQYGQRVPLAKTSGRRYRSRMAINSQNH
jgi:hypothetical protein